MAISVGLRVEQRALQLLISISIVTFSLSQIACLRHVRRNIHLIAHSFPRHQLDTHGGLRVGASEHPVINRHPHHLHLPHRRTRGMLATSAALSRLEIQPVMDGHCCPRGHEPSGWPGQLRQLPDPATGAERLSPGPPCDQETALQGGLGCRITTVVSLHKRTYTQCAHARMYPPTRTR